MDSIHLTLAVFVFALGACVGSFLNVVVYRLPLGKSLVKPPSSCPKCGHRLAAYDNVPIFGWLWLRGKCRYCKEPISARYPLIEFVTGALFLAQFVLLFHYGWGPYEVTHEANPLGILIRHFRTPRIENDWPVLLLHLWLIASLLAASLIDLEHFIIPLGICWLLAAVGAAGQSLLIKPGALGSLHMDPIPDAIALGAGIGLLLSLLLLGTGIFKRSFEDDAPLLEMERDKIAEADQPDPWPASRIRAEMRKEVIFLLPPVALSAAAAALVMSVPAITSVWERISAEPNVSGFLGALLGALVGGFIVWFFRIAGSYGFGREAMGLGDVHLMFGIGAVVGAGGSTVAFFLAPIFGLSLAVLQLIVSGRREIPYGPYLSLAAYFVLLFYTPISEYLRPGMQGLVWMVQDQFGVLSIQWWHVLVPVFFLALLVLVIWLSRRGAK